MDISLSLELTFFTYIRRWNEINTQYIIWHTGNPQLMLTIIHPPIHLINNLFDGAVTFHLKFIFGNFISWKFIFFSFERVIFLMSQNSQHSTKLYKIYEEFTLLGIKYAGKVTMHPIFQSQSHPAHTYHSSLLINSIPFLSKVTWVWIINYVIPYTYMVCLDLRL